ncbi:hypothetical protein Sjap_013071 [Stephania japonica]|uniref:Dilute domain-containing protein n=1 Tax=Stephania japonica TaxID=461633 RepID=A0AAP0IX86_9MAGN
MASKESKDETGDVAINLEKELMLEKEEESDCETSRYSVSSQGDAPGSEDKKVEQGPRNAKKLAKKDSAEGCTRAARPRKERTEASKKQVNASNKTPKKTAKTNGDLSKVTAKNASTQKSSNMKVHPKPSSESSDGLDDKPIDVVKEIDKVDEVSSGSQSIASDEETADVAENGLNEGHEKVNQRVEEMELKIDKLEEELREVAVLEISLYSVVPEHGSSAHKVHTPARRLSRLYIYACKQWTQDKRATIAKNIVSGLVLTAKSCGSDIPRLTFWLSNTVALREILSQAFGSSLNSSTIAHAIDLNASIKKSDGKPSSLKWKGSPGGKQVKIGLNQFLDDWQETRTFTSALERVESWIFSRIVESVWWQSLTPHMQSPMEAMFSSTSCGKLLGPTLGDEQQGSFSINLWKSAFQDAFQRLCPVRAVGHECGCLPILARMVMEQCVTRLDVAMFNAILRESVHEIPTDPMSDPIVDSKVLPIPAGDLSFGSGAQLKNSVGTWSRWLSDLFGMDINESADDTDRQDDRWSGDTEPKCFRLLNALSDLLMLPKDMLLDRSIRKEVCPAIGLPLVKRILCNFTPDEFCPDPVPGAVLEALNAESVVEYRLANGEATSSFPYCAAPVAYVPPSGVDMAVKVGNAGGRPQLHRNASIIERRGYTSDEDLDELNYPLESIIDKESPRSANGNGNHKENSSCGGVTARYELLRQVWTA